jgi:GNAT superfamily N-acetyltransferase
VRPGWTQEYLLALGHVNVGYGSIAIGGPWKEKPTVYEFYVAPPHRLKVFELFSALLEASGAVAIETQSNDTSLTLMLHAFARDVASESILFHDRVTTALPSQGAIFRATTPGDENRLAAQDLDTSADWLVELDGVVAGAGGVLFHYNRPYGDIYMKVAEGFRRRGLGAFLVQEMKRVSYERGNVPAARCSPTNIASRQTLQKAGFVPCGHLLVGAVVR